ncbi:TPA: peptidylprolyl isomerase [Photobacterium damselae]|uniref:Peptidyl-prolyl cis-trans isomerase n=4 Tax=Photobacterium damselae TaxID=38293 RepID=D0Z1L5_PHODD|nr:peptidylprolyl isomerase [Photobacterium damselae]ARR50348.1 peptidylprolyl isomerase [Photobacterium damselae subsp. damselae]AWK80835.1 peptidylprolyl isomerase [Photobacterium damselae]EEZ42396.1 FKBP-type peptidyl-prolyl cis-trans isomerase SlyD [Photobacterium damselae subsp. damselae CIP 102761]EHA1080876.1 peptidylprolyl isomerase [Photobacterium damselae]EJN6959489.1 peptidylprolyl isomerase [Photobacterium damselae]
MKVAKDVVVSLAYQVKNEDGVVVDQATVEAPLDYIHGHNNLIVGLENAIENHEAGDKFEVTVAPEEAYGEYLDAMVQRVPAEVFHGVDEITVGMRFLADTDQGPIPVEVTEVDGDFVVVDGNHMLAGQTLTFDVEVVALRPATEEEIAHGHLHQGGGCCGGHGDCGDHDHGNDEGCCGGEGHGGCGCSH